MAETPELGEEVLLAIDTALGTSVALGVDGRVFESASTDTRGHAERIGVLIADVFEAAGVAPARVTGVVVGIGPGPFTGLRIGIAAAHAFALGRGVPVLPLHGHEAVALCEIETSDAAAPSSVSAPPTLRVVQDAKRRELFVTDYSHLDADGIPVRVSGPAVVPAGDAAPGQGDAGDVRERPLDAVREVWPETIPAAALVRLAARRLAVGRAFEPDRALYLRQPDVQAPVAPKRVGS
ncbi:MAG: tRNA (adenosine(37)-N6)-threonylcarbamoyltransferase complex dimerization subunit type 1 TsaB [Leucobacter sp.]